MSATSAYEVSRFCHRLTIDPAHRREAQDALPAALARFDLTVRERRAVAEGDVAFLLAHGVHPLLLVRLHVFGIAGLTAAAYSARMRAGDANR